MLLLGGVTKRLHRAPLTPKGARLHQITRPRPGRHAGEVVWVWICTVNWSNPPRAPQLAFSTIFLRRGVPAMIVIPLGINQWVIIIKNASRWNLGKCKMPLATTDRLRFVEFLGLIAGLLTVFVSTNSIYFPFGLPSESVLVLLLIVFIAYSLFVYVEILSREKTSTKFIFIAAIYFSIILSLLFSGTILKAFSVEASTSPALGALLFAVLVLLYNVVILVPIQKIMRDEPPEKTRDSPSVIG